MKITKILVYIPIILGISLLTGCPNREKLMLEVGAFQLAVDDFAELIEDEPRYADLVSDTNDFMEDLEQIYESLENTNIQAKEIKSELSFTQKSFRSLNKSVRNALKISPDKEIESSWKKVRTKFEAFTNTSTKAAHKKAAYGTPFEARAKGNKWRIFKGQVRYYDAKKRCRAEDMKLPSIKEISDFYFQAVDESNPFNLHEEFRSTLQTANTIWSTEVLHNTIENWAYRFYTVTSNIEEVLVLVTHNVYSSKPVRYEYKGQYSDLTLCVK